MENQIILYEKIKTVVSFFSRHLKFDKFKNTLGRKLALSLEDILAASLFKQKNNIATKKATYEILKPNCSYKTLVVNINRFSQLAVIILVLLMKINRSNSHPVKHIDSTDIPVCLFKNAHNHKTMKGLAEFGRSGKGTFYGLRMHLITDLRRRILRVRFTAGNVDEREMVIPLSKDLIGIFMADAGYISQKLAREFYQEHKRVLLVKPRANMKKLMTEFEEWLYSTRMLIELNFRNLKMFYGLVTSLPRSVDEYLANYIYSLLAYQII
ncbi:MAG: IS982 family transposase [bacterium]|nr:IS982 family transposase [bacterium]